MRDFPADGERLTADAPVGMTHTLVNGVPIRVDGAPAEDGLAARPGVVLAQLSAPPRDAEYCANPTLERTTS